MNIVGMLRAKVWKLCFLGKDSECGRFGVFQYDALRRVQEASWISLFIRGLLVSDIGFLLCAFTRAELRAHVLSENDSSTVIWLLSR